MIAERFRETFGLGNEAYYRHSCIPDESDPCVKKGVELTGWYNLPHRLRRNMCVKKYNPNSDDNEDLGCCVKRWPWTRGCCTVDFEDNTQNDVVQWAKNCGVEHKIVQNGSFNPS